jgi:hypothetical protein
MRLRMNTVDLPSSSSKELQTTRASEYEDANAEMANLGLGARRLVA